MKLHSFLLHNNDKIYRFVRRTVGMSKLSKFQSEPAKMASSIQRLCLYLAVEGTSQNRILKFKIDMGRFLVV